VRGVINLNAMTTPADSPSGDPRMLADISMLADGSIDASRREEVAARIAASPELSSLYERERRVVELLHEARSADRAPAALRARIEASRPSRAVRTRRRVGFGGALAGALAAAALALALILPAGSPGAPSVSQAAGFALLGAQTAPPSVDPETPKRLDTLVGAVYFPNWSKRFGSPATGARTDTIGGRQAVTVYYNLGGKEIAYTIVAAPALKMPAAPVTTLRGIDFRTLRQGDRVVVTWRRDGQTCVLSASGVSPLVLQRLGAWEAPGVTL
jgi:hypothetical protein